MWERQGMAGNPMPQPLGGILWRRVVVAILLNYLQVASPRKRLLAAHVLG